MKSFDWRRAAAEMAVIVVSVLFALLVDDWRQGQEESRVEEAILLSLGSELERNQIVLERRLGIHEQMLVTIERGGFSLDSIVAVRQRSVAESAAENPDLELAPELFALDPPLVGSAWDAARATEAVSRLDPGRLLSFSTLYGLQDQLSSTEGALVAAHREYVRAGFEGGDRAYATYAISAALRELVGREAQLCEEYRDMAIRLYDAPANEGRCGSGNIVFR